MRFLHTNLIVALLTVGAIHADPVIFIKNTSDRTVLIEPFGRFNNPLIRPPQLVKPKGEYKDDSLAAADIKGIRVVYCPKGSGCISIDTIRERGTVATFEFHDPNATKYYLKLDIDTNDNVSLKRQEGRAGRTSNLKWNLKGNIIQDAITRPITEPAAPPAPTDVPAPHAKPKTQQLSAPSTDMPPALQSSATSPKRKMPERPTIPAPTEEEDIAITLMPGTFEQKTIIPAPQ
jgi:hypothetical protein